MNKQFSWGKFGVFDNKADRCLKVNCIQDDGYRFYWYNIICNSSTV